MTVASAYTRLPGRSRRYFGVPYAIEFLITFTLVAVIERLSIYRGGDHLLVLRRQFFTESAHRFYFSDIQAITVQRTAAHMVVNVVLLCLMMGFAAFALAAPAYLTLPQEDILAISVLGVVVAAALAINILLGPTCVTRLYTAVHCEPLFCLARWRTALRFVEEVRPHIEAAQESPAATAPTESGLPIPAQYAVPRSALRKGAPLTDAPGRLHTLFFWLVLVLAASSAIDLLAASMLKNVGDALLYLAALLVGCLAAARQRRSTLPADLRVITGLALVTLVVLFYVGQFISFTAGFMIPGKPTVQSMLNPDHPAVQITASLSLCAFAAVGLLGLIRVHRFQLSRSSARVH